MSPKVVAVAANEGVSEEELLGVALAVELLSDHPLARAIARDAEARLGSRPYFADDFRSLTGKGVSASVAGETVLIAKPSIFDGKDVVAMPPGLAAKVADMIRGGQTMMVVLKGERFLGAIAVGAILHHLPDLFLHHLRPRARSIDNDWGRSWGSDCKLSVAENSVEFLLHFRNVNALP